MHPPLSSAPDPAGNLDPAGTSAVNPAAQVRPFRPRLATATGSSRSALVPLCTAATALWQPLLVKPTEASTTVIVELMAQDIRVSLRNLTIANAIRRETSANLVALIGVDPDWNESIWPDYSHAQQKQLATAFGATDIIDVHAVVAERLAGTPTNVTVAGSVLPRPRTTADPETLRDIVRASVARILKVPRLTEEIRQSQAHQHTTDMAAEFSGLYDSLIAHTNACAVVTSHVDYVFWGLLVDSARRARVPITHVQTTGSVKAYTLFPDHDPGGQSFRAALTPQIAGFFEDRVVRHREVLRRSAELVTARSRSNHGMPSWWRGGGTMSALEIRSAEERRALRETAATRFGFDAAQPTIGVYNHAVSDALNTNLEAFADLGAWFEQTAEFAADHPEVNWLFLDHPSQILYDNHGFFDSVAARYRSHGHMAFTPSMRLSKNVIFSLVDLGLTTRGSVSNELPAFGIPAIQAGWSEWSHCGISTVAEDPKQYWHALQEAIDSLVERRPLVSRDEIERARLWTWFYRVGADVATPFVPHWSVADSRTLIASATKSMINVPPDGDPVLVAVARMWRRREPVLTVIDSSTDSDTVAERLGLPIVADLDQRAKADRARVGLGPIAFHSEFDDIADTLDVPGGLNSGTDPRLAAVDWVSRGEAIIGRVTRPKSLFAIRVSPPTSEFVRCTVTIGRDSISDGWWDRHVKDPSGPAAGRLRLVQVRILSRPPEIVPVTTPSLDVTAVLSRDEIAHGLLVIELTSVALHPDALDLCLPDAAVGTRLSSAALAPVDVMALRPTAEPLFPSFLPLTPHSALVTNRSGDQPARVRTVSRPGRHRRIIRSAQRLLTPHRRFDLDLPARPLLDGDSVAVTARGADRGRPGVFVELTTTAPAIVELSPLPRPVGTRWVPVTTEIPELSRSMP